MRCVLKPALVAVLLVAMVATTAAAQDEQPETEFEGSVELIYRAVGQQGSDARYREDFDGLSSGLRLGNFEARWQSTGAAFADYFRIEAGGLGGDPYERTAVTLGRRDAYELKLNHTRQTYLYDLFELARDTDGSTWDSNRDITELDLTVHATSKFDVFFGYRENRREGTSLFMKDVQTDLFRMETPLDQESRTYWVGGKLQLGSASILLRQELRRNDYRFDNTTRGDAGLNQADAVTLTDYAWRQQDDREANLTTISLATPLGDRVHLTLTAHGDLLGDDELDSRVTLDAAGTNRQGAPFAISGGTSRADLELEHTAIDADLSFRLADPLDFHVQYTRLDREVEGTQLRDLNGNGVIDDTAGTVFDGTPGSTISEEYSLDSLTGLFDWSPIRALRLQAGFRTLDRELKRSGFEYGTNENRNDRFESDGDDTLILGVVAKPADWVELHADYEEGDVTQALTAVSPMETDRLRFRARFKPTDTMRLDLQHLDYENTNRGLDFRDTASCTGPGGGIEAGCWNTAVEGTSGAVSLWHRPHKNFDYQLRYAVQDTDSVVRVRFDTELFFNSAENGDSIYDNRSTQWSGIANVRWAADAWNAYVRIQGNDADGDNALIGPAFRDVLVIDQDYLDLEFGLTHTFDSGLYVGGRIRSFEYDDVRRVFAYDGDILTLVAGLRF